MSRKFGKYKITAFAKFLIFMGIAGLIIFGTTNVAENVELSADKKQVNFYEIKEALKQKIKDKRLLREHQLEDYTPTEEKMKERLLILIEENERLADELEDCKNQKTQLAITE